MKTDPNFPDCIAFDSFVGPTYRTSVALVTCCGSEHYRSAVTVTAHVGGHDMDKKSTPSETSSWYRRTETSSSLTTTISLTLDNKDASTVYTILES